MVLMSTIFSSFVIQNSECSDKKKEGITNAHLLYDFIKCRNTNEKDPSLSLRRKGTHMIYDN